VNDPRQERARAFRLRRGDAAVIHEQDAAGHPARKSHLFSALPWRTLPCFRAQACTATGPC
jgi:hypothetical protein